MIEPFASGFELDTEFERYVLSKAVPLINNGSASATLHLDDGPTIFYVKAHMTIGRSDTQVVDELGLRPLLFGAAWKILDVLIDHALWKQAGEATARYYSISKKVKAACAGAVKFHPLDAHPTLLERVCAAYVRAEEYRHSITHRRVHIGPQSQLVGFDRSGRELPSLSVDEQVAFCRMAQRVLACVTSGDDSKRKMASLGRELNALTSLTGLPVQVLQPDQEVVPVVNISVNSSQELDIACVKRKVYSAFPKSREADVIFKVEDEDGLSFLCQLEEAPDERLFLTRDTISPWLQRL